MSEVGAVIIVGGNINHVTRVMTTTIALETSKGNLQARAGARASCCSRSRWVVNAGVMSIRGVGGAVGPCLRPRSRGRRPSRWRAGRRPAAAAAAGERAVLRRRPQAPRRPRRCGDPGTPPAPVIMGANGTGKSLLLAAAARPDTADVGRGAVAGTPPWTARAAADRQWCFSVRSCCAGPVRANLRFVPVRCAASAARNARPGRRRRSNGARLHDLASRPARVLSAGEQQRLAGRPARWRAHPRVLLLDEPTSSLDPGFDPTRSSSSSGRRMHPASPIVLVTHDVGQARGGLGDDLNLPARRGGSSKTGRVPDVLDAPRSEAGPAPGWRADCISMPLREGAPESRGHAEHESDTHSSASRRPLVWRRRDCPIRPPRRTARKTPAHNPPQDPAHNHFILVQSTTSTLHSGLYDHILPLFTGKTGIEVRVVAVGTGQAIRNAANGVTATCCWCTRAGRRGEIRGRRARRHALRSDVQRLRHRRPAVRSRAGRGHDRRGRRPRDDRRDRRHPSRRAATTAEPTGRSSGSGRRPASTRRAASRRLVSRDPARAWARR